MFFLRLLYVWQFYVSLTSNEFISHICNIKAHVFKMNMIKNVKIFLRISFNFLAYLAFIKVFYIVNCQIVDQHIRCMLNVQDIGKWLFKKKNFLWINEILWYLFRRFASHVFLFQDFAIVHLLLHKICRNCHGTMQWIDGNAAFTYSYNIRVI